MGKPFSEITADYSEPGGWGLNCSKAASAPATKTNAAAHVGHSAVSIVLAGLVLIGAALF
jgi:hypothetical protein